MDFWRYTAIDAISWGVSIECWYTLGKALNSHLLLHQTGGWCCPSVWSQYHKRYLLCYAAWWSFSAMPVFTLVTFITVTHRMLCIWSACMNWGIDDKRKNKTRSDDMSVEKCWCGIIDYRSVRKTCSQTDIHATSQAGSKYGKASELTILRGIDAGVWWCQVKAGSHRASNGNLWNTRLVCSGYMYSWCVCIFVLAIHGSRTSDTSILLY